MIYDFISNKIDTFLMLDNNYETKVSLLNVDSKGAKFTRKVEIETYILENNHIVSKDSMKLSYIIKKL